ncbi:F0F1 ATP synthase subunit delta [Nocardioides marmoriginsengisoli]|uniref:ATP synthase subunit delta n=1 Tax=Nocardioides marmoriginsengisoli TaxID=661483 RepID=A0A3N0CQF4_9ACTN|nr:F0F1 ATP synthase subunit delta [Nocardioides marmoriginsengisoli]RNL65246.1 F0F1 ATP synthase subunit delta [Nocardioides marmoriginsengisoli]
MVLRGASAEARSGLRAALDAAVGSDTAAATLGEDLLGAAAVLRAEPGLRRMVTDQAIDAAAKSGLARQVFDGKISAAGLGIVGDAVARRWTTTRDLADVLEYLGVVAVVKSAGADSTRLADELFALSQLVGEHADLRGALSDPTRTAADKGVLLASLLDGKALAATQRLAVLALNGSHRTVVVALAEFQKIAAAVKDEGVAKVRVARALTAADRDRLQSALSRQYGRPVHLNVSVEPGLVGGMRVEIGDDVIDGSVSSRLDDARRRLAG